MKFMIKILALVSLITTISGCSNTCCFVYTSKNEDNYSHMIIGFGLIKTPRLKNGTAYTASQATSFGVNISNQPGFKLSLGYSHDTSILVSDKVDDLLLEVSTCDTKGIKVKSGTSASKQWDDK